MAALLPPGFGIGLDIVVLLFERPMVRRLDYNL
jgi:hypothetical protein